MRAKTSAVSAICGTHLAETKLPASIAFNPVAERRSISSTLISSGTVFASFCRPSRGPTSTMRTRSGSRISALRRFQPDQLGPVLDQIADGEIDRGDHAVGGRDDGMLHLHRLERHERRAA